MNRKVFIPMTLVMIAGLAACDHQPSPAALQAREAAKAADDRVAQIEKELADVKAGKGAGPGDPDARDHVHRDQAKALERRLADARKVAAQAHKDVFDIEEGPASMPAAQVVEVPAGTALPVSLSAGLATDQAQAGDPWEGVLAEDVLAGGKVAWPKGTPVKGVVAQSTPAGRLRSGKGGLGIRLSAVGRNDVEAGTYLVSGGALGQRDARFIGGGAALGALVGILSSRGHQADHALGGAAIGAAAGTGVAAGTADTVIRIPAGRPIVFNMTAPERVTLK